MTTWDVVVALSLVLHTVSCASGPLHPIYNLVPGQPFLRNETVGPDSDVILKFSFNNSYTPRISTQLFNLHVPSSVGYSLSDACFATSFFLPPSQSSDSDKCSVIEASRLLCQRRCPISGMFSLALSSFSTQNVSLDISLENIAISLNQPRKVTVRPWAPVFLRYDFLNSENVQFSLRSASAATITVSIQNESCPVFDTPDNVAYQESRPML